jgi:transcriptional regulator with XRE-family HTH domain
VNISNRIRVARRAAGLSQEEVARRAGLSLKGMGDIERGDIEDPHFSSLVKIAHALDVPVESLIKEEEPALAGKAEASRETGPPEVKFADPEKWGAPEDRPGPEEQIPESAGQRIHVAGGQVTRTAFLDVIRELREGKISSDEDAWEQAVERSRAS